MFDTNKKEIIYDKIADGSVIGPFAIDVSAVTMSGVVIDSFRKVLADKKFAATVENSL